MPEPSCGGEQDDAELMCHAGAKAHSDTTWSRFAASSTPHSWARNGLQEVTHYNDVTALVPLVHACTFALGFDLLNPGRKTAVWL